MVYKITKKMHFHHFRNIRRYISYRQDCVPDVIVADQRLLFLIIIKPAF